MHKMNKMKTGYDAFLVTYLFFAFVIFAEFNWRTE